MDRTRRKTASTVVTRLPKRSLAKEACLVVIYGGELGRKYNLNVSSLVIGRSSKCDIQVDHPSVSRNHAKIQRNGKQLVVRDLGSTNGTYINDERRETSALKDRDLVKVGHTIFKFLSGGNIESAYHEEIYRLTTVDGLTQTYNKRYLIESLERELSRSQRHGRGLSLILMDIDHFKVINDTHGHLAGDAVLKQLASLIKGKIRREDLFARFGGEEFAIVLPETNLPSALQFAEKIGRLVAGSRFEFDGKALDIRVSLGVTTTDGRDMPAEEFIKRADEKLYEAKRTGRNRVCG